MCERRRVNGNTKCIEDQFEYSNNKSEKTLFLYINIDLLADRNQHFIKLLN